MKQIEIKMNERMKNENSQRIKRSEKLTEIKRLTDEWMKMNGRIKMNEWTNEWIKRNELTNENIWLNEWVNQNEWMNEEWKQLNEKNEGMNV